MGPHSLKLKSSSDPPVSTGHAPRKFATLDGMRGVAALAVLFLHLKSVVSPLAAPNGALAVDLFFVLSGFIIAYAYEDKIRNGLDAVEFFKIRAIRLYPLYILGTLIGLAWLVMNVAGGGSSAGVAITFGLAALLCIPLFRPDTPFGPYPLDPPAWSLFFEIAVNMVYVVVFPFLTTRRLVFAVVAGWIGLLLSGWLAGPLHGVIYPADLVGGACRTIASFGAGLLVYRFRHVMKWKLSPIVLLAICAALFSLDLSGPYATPLRFLAIFPAMPLLVWCGAATEPSGRLAGLFHFLGRTSYGLYALHWPLMVVASAILSAHGVDPSAYRPWAGMVFIAGLLIVAASADRYYDTPIRACLSRQFLSGGISSKLSRQDAL